MPLDGGKGRLILSEQAGQAVVTAVLPDEGKGLYRLWLVGAGGRVPAGTFLPADGGLALRRTIPVRALEGQGAWPVQKAVAELFFRAGETAPPPGPPEPPLRQRPETAQAEVHFSAPFRLRLLDGLIAADVPWQPGREHPAPDLFCLSTLYQEDGVSFLRFCFTPAGAPCLPGKRGI